METYNCRRCGKDKLLNKENWYHQKLNKTGFDTSKCKDCAKKYNKTRYYGTFVKGETYTPRKRPSDSFELACIKYKVRLAAEPVISIFKDVL